MTSVKKISIIVAVYNAEAYLKRCIDSLLMQTFADFEILLIDDGSTDHSGEICDDYAVKDSRICVFHRTNQGVSATRQFGIDNARGEYTIHADSDDWVESDMLELLCKKAKEDDADLIFCDFYVDKRGKQNHVSQKQKSLDRKYLMKSLFQQFHGSCCNKLIRLDCYKKYNIHFPEKLNYCEDFMVVMDLLSQPIKVSYLEKAFYHYCYNNTSITNKKTDISFIKQLELWVKLLEERLLFTNQYESEIVRMKCKIKRTAFLSGVLSTQEYQTFYPEVNRFVLNMDKKRFINFLVYISVTINYRIAYILFVIMNSIQQLVKQKKWRIV